jgi:hypothetical protein
LSSANKRSILSRSKKRSIVKKNSSAKKRSV